MKLAGIPCSGTNGQAPMTAVIVDQQILLKLDLIQLKLIKMSQLVFVQLIKLTIIANKYLLLKNNL